MRTEAHQFKSGVVNFAVNQNKIRLDMAIAATSQLSDKRIKFFSVYA
jgi:hypothetical protein